MAGLPVVLQGKYEILRDLAEGGMGTVYLARHLALDQVRVLKVIRASHGADSEFQARFVREAKLASQVRHKNLVTLFDFVTGDDGIDALVLEYVDGVSLEEIIAGRFRTLGTSFVLEILEQTLEAIGALHRFGIVHRDISPDNLLLTSDDEGHPLVKLIDLGIAHSESSREENVTRTGSLLGKIRYVAPEVIQGKPATAASDLYALGLVAYELLTGTYPYAVSSFTSTLYAHMQAEPASFEVSDPSGAVPAEVRAVVLRCLAKEPGARYSSAVETRSAFLAAGSELPSFSLAKFQELAAKRPTPKPQAETTPVSTAIRRTPAPPPPPTSPVVFHAPPPPAAPADSHAAGNTLVSERYQILEELGRGARGRLYRAWDTMEARLVALKVFDSHGAHQADDRQRFLRSTREWRRTDHDNVVRAVSFDPGDTSHAPCVAFELLDGTSLEEFLRRTPQLSAVEKYKIAAALLGGLDHLHKLGIIHRDVRPRNVFVTPGLGLKILESGIAKRPGAPDASLTVVAPSFFHTPYSAPEGEIGESEFRGDVYSAGVVLLQIFSGSLAPEAASPTARLQTIGALAGTEGLRRTLRRALEVDPERRFRTAGELRDALVAVATEEFGVQAIDFLGESRASQRSRGVVVMLHGIRTHAKWQRAFSEVAFRRGWNCRTDRWNFGYFSALRLVLPSARKAKIEWMRQTYDAEMKDREVDLELGTYPSIVAHSFGTYILGYALLHYDYLRFDRVILCGSILPPDFPWQRILSRGQVRSVRNEYGTHDVWSNLVRWMVWDAGPSGVQGFAESERGLEQEEFTFSHSEYFEKSHMREKWLTFLEKPL